MSSLIPERRADKRGNIVTRWVRSFGQKNMTKRIPAPVAPPLHLSSVTLSPELQKKVSVLCESLKTGVLPSGFGHLPENVEVIAKCDPELLDRIAEAVKADDADLVFWSEQMRQGYDLRDYDQPRLEYVLGKYHASFTIKEALNNIADHGGNTRAHLYSRTSYEAIIDVITHGEFPEEVLPALTLAIYIKGVNEDCTWSSTDKKSIDPASVLKEANFIAGYSDKMDILIPELLKRRVCDSETVARLMENPAQALMEGDL